MSTEPPSPPTADPALQADARDLHRALEDLLRVVQFRDRDRICCHDLSVTQCYALDALARSGPLSSNGLAEALYLDKSTASRVASALERKGHLERRPDPEDGRAVILETTDSGDRLLRKIEKDLVSEVREMIRPIDPEARRQTIHLLERLAAVASSRVERSGGCCTLP
ncbi:MAG: MarR family transcriptional regulator [Thermoanaerobaculia bacterium]|nr:MarR family transcriptional regulator [Thermoanaerobaculia bacterium]